MNIFLISLIPWIIYIIIKINRPLMYIQQNVYDSSMRYFKWCIKNWKKSLVALDILGMLFAINFKYNFIVFMLLFLINIILVYNQYKKEELIKPLVVTSRIKRMCVTITIMYLIPITIMISKFNADHIGIYYLILSLCSYIIYFVVLLANRINFPVEKCVYFSYKHKATKKLKSMKNLQIIGITGSYGKTSSKNILSSILNVKYNALPTPKNLNTPYGLMITINNYLDKFDDIFIAEMGAYFKGEIKTLCDFVHPKYGILTKIGKAHMETFGSQKKIQEGKFELIESLPSDGVAILNKDDELQTSYNLKNKVKIIWIAIYDKTADVYAENIKYSMAGTSFDCVFNNTKEKIHLETKLLGEPNIYNILAAIALGKYLGLSNQELINGTAMTKPVEHRLEIKQNGDITFLDDAYNSNEIGAKMALDTLKLMDGKKIIITPGMVELGKESYDVNKKFGIQMCDVCDEIILVKNDMTNYIKEGIEEKKYSIEHLHIVNTEKEALSLIYTLKGKKTYVLLENDLPDIFK